MMRVSVLKLLCNVLLSAVIFLLPRAIASPSSDDMMEVSSLQSTTDVTLKLERHVTAGAPCSGLGQRRAVRYTRTLHSLFYLQ
jgi:hypothetical protein